MGFLCFGALLGAALGFLSGTTDLLIWELMNRPDFMIRKGWEEVDLAVSVVYGLLVGLLYGATIRRFTQMEQLSSGRAFIVVSTIILASGIYALGDYISLKTLNCLAWFAARIVVFLLSLMIARGWMIRHRGSEGRM